MSEIESLIILESAAFRAWQEAIAATALAASQYESAKENTLSAKRNLVVDLTESDTEEPQCTHRRKATRPPCKSWRD